VGLYLFNVTLDIIGRARMRERNVYIAVIIVIILALASYASVSHRRGAESPLVDKTISSLVAKVNKSLDVSVEGINNGWIDKKFTCDSLNEAPLIVVKGIPNETMSLVLIMYDPDAPRGTFIHWICVWKVSNAKEVVLSERNASVEGLNYFGRIGYGGPCPPKGGKPHRYFFLILALNEVPNVKERFTFHELLNAVKGHIIAYGYDMGKYAR
jgi:Raf kinase inhibitor-like YbhB/YbcL family protein